MKTPCLLAGMLLLALTPADATGPTYGLDLNGNGLSDLFERSYPGATTPTADTDGDGQTNEQEAAAGTDPTSSSSVFGFTAVTQTPDDISARWAGVRGKLYQMQMSTDLAGTTWQNEGTALLGTGQEVTGTCPTHADRVFLRLVVTDTDSDGDGLTDWEETLAGTDPLNTDTAGNGLFDDFDMVSHRLHATSVVDVAAGDAIAAEAGPNAGTFVLTRRGGLDPLIVPFTLGGTATAGVDYTASPVSSVYFGLGETRATVTITPVADAFPEPVETVTLTLGAGASYALGADTVAALAIDDLTTVGGTGLLGQYFDNASSTYTSASNFNPLDLRATRLDAGVNFLWNGTGGNPDRPHPDLLDADYHSVRWTGQVLPQFSETYTFFVQANAGARLVVNGQEVLNAWNTGQSGVEVAAAPVDLLAGHRYDVVLEYFDQTGTSHCYLRWQSASQAKGIVPASRLYPYGENPPLITGQPFLVGLVGGPVNHTLTATNSPVSYSASALPDGLTLNTSTGVISGTPTGPAGVTWATVGATNPAGTGTAVIAIILLDTGGGAVRDVWTGLAGTSLTALPWHTPPAETTAVTELAAPADAGDNFADRLRGWITAPATGRYTFFLTTEDENAEFWLSANADPSRRLKRSFVQNAAPAGVWNGVPTQKSLPVALTAGQRYYFEALRKEATGGDSLAIGWIRPGQPDADVPAEVVPAWCLSPYVPEGGAVEGELLYIATLTPQNGAMTLGGGAAVMTVNELETEALISVQWANLTGPKTQWHVHDASRNGAIIFDFDTALPEPDGRYRWVFAPTGGITVDDIRQTIRTGQAYVNIHTAAYPPGEIRGFLQLSTGSRSFIPPSDPPALADTPPTVDEAVRFLNQATYGFSPVDADSDGQFDSVKEVQDLGYAGWLDRQMNPAQTPPTLLRPQVTQYYLDYPQPDGGNAESSREIQRFWWKAAMTAPDQLRQRIAFALSEILVVSEVGTLDENATALTHHYDVLVSGAFGNFRDLLENVTLNYAMGRYLDMAGNKKPDPSINRTANENYAREIMQLFSIGLRRLHPDGTLVLGADGLPVATYEQEEIVGLANNFTGWQRDYSPAADAFYRAQYTLPMTLNNGGATATANNHYFGDKPFLDGTVIPARPVSVENATRDLADSHDVLFHHPNVGPFLSRLLIQRLVTANPSPGYIWRVSRAFEDDGAGTRGNLGAVVRAIFLDWEARSSTVAQQPGYGHLKEPLLRATNWMRALGAVSRSEGKAQTSTTLNPAFDGNNRSQTVPHYLPRAVNPPSPGWDMGSTNGSLAQNPLGAPTVFNFFEPDFVFNGYTGAAGLYGPEFQITAETTVVNTANWFYDFARSGKGNTTNWDDDPWDKSVTVANPPTHLDVDGTVYRYSTTSVNGVAYPESPQAPTSSTANNRGVDIVLDTTHERSLANNATALVDWLSFTLLNNAMSPELRTTLVNHLNATYPYPGSNEATTRANRVNEAVYLIAISPEFSVQK